MKKYEKIRRDTERKGTIAAIVLVTAFHASLTVFGLTSGFTYLNPPPPEQSFLIDFSEPDTPVKVIQQRRGSAPLSENPDRSRPVNLVQRSEAQEKGTQANEASEATVDDFGDVEKYEPAREKPIDRRALFHAADNKTDKDTLAAQTASKVSDALKAGHAQGNTKNGKAYGEPNAHLKGRNTVGNVQRPAYEAQESGIVVMDIWVDQYGTVQKASVNATGTTVNNEKLWAAARSAAMNTHFNQTAEAGALQKGTITYHFNLVK